MWNLLQLSGALDLELASAMAESVSITAWEPERRVSPPPAHSNHLPSRAETDNLCVCSFPIVRGYTRFPISYLVPTNRIVLELLLDSTPDPAHSPLICTIPYFAELAERWPGPVIYWLTDLIAAYDGANKDLVMRSDRRLCEAATLVCPNSPRIADYLVHKVGCHPAKIDILPNAVRAQNLLATPLLQPSPLPSPVAHLQRPVAGVIGNMAASHDWVILAEVIEYTPKFSWLFVGPTSMPIRDRAQREARAAVMRHPRCTFIGSRPYGELVEFSRAVDVAVLPYAKREPTFSGSSTRFYEHLAACRPMIAFPGVSELLTKSPLVSIAESAKRAARQLEFLRRRNFDDGLIELRWRAAQGETWQSRAQSMQEALAVRLGSQPSYSETQFELPTLR
jgi:glycosyltransferase involved in cell wall biosynthesis